MSTSIPDHTSNQMIAKLKSKIKRLELEKKKAHQKSQNELANLKYYYESILAILPGHIYCVDKHNHYLFCNNLQAQNIKLPSREAIVGKTNDDLLPKAQASALNAINIEIMRTGLPQTDEEYADMAHGPGVFLSHKVPLYNKENEIIGLLGVSLDITKQKQTEQALAIALEKAESANRAKNTFIANMSHDIRTPLTGVIGMSQLLEQQLQNEKEKQYARWIHESGNQLLKLLNGILEITSAEQVNEHTLNETSFSLSHCLKELTHLERPAALIKGLDFRVEIDPNLPELIITDRAKIHRVLLNLISNAVKFTHHGFVKIKVIQDSETQETCTLTFSIQDSGIGIPKSLQTKIFDRFFRGNPSDKGLYPGYGVGLHIVHAYVQMLGGRIHVESEKGKGSTFTCQLTFKKDLSSHTTMKLKQPIVPHSSHTKPRLLLIEDNLIALKLLEHLTHLANYPFLSADSAEAALKILETETVDVIITDIGLPGLSGIELTQEIRKSKTLHQPIIIGLTAYAPEETTHACLHAGMHRVLTKPVDFKQLETAFQNLLSSPSAKSPSLGYDLPATETALFNLTAYPLLDLQQAIQMLSSQIILKEMLTLMLHEQIPQDLVLLQEAFIKNNWSAIESLAHKMKAGALYCGTRRMHMACQYLERYRKAGYSKALEALYRQLLTVLEETKEAIGAWLVSFEEVEELG